MTPQPIRNLLRPALLALGLGFALWWALPGDPVASLRRQGLGLAHVDRRAAPDLGERVERWRIVTLAGDTLSALWRAAAPGRDRPWTVVLFGGLVAGDRAALLVPDDTPSHVLAVDWPWHGARSMPWWRIALQIGAIRQALLRSPAVLALGVEAAAQAPEVDPERIALAGVSLGVPPAVAALRLTRRPAALVLLHGAADLRGLLRHGLTREGVPALLATPLAGLGGRLIQPLEPSLHAAAAADTRPVLLINTTDDPMLPRASVEQLHRLFRSADVRWAPPLHGAAEPGAAIAEATHEIQAWLDATP